MRQRNSAWDFASMDPHYVFIISRFHFSASVMLLLELWCFQDNISLRYAKKKIKIQGFIVIIVLMTQGLFGVSI